MVTKRTGQPRGRPSIPVWKDKERYILAFIEAKSLLLHGHVSRSELLLTAAMMQFGYPEDSCENAKALHEGRKVKVIAPHLKFRGNKNSAEFRDKSEFHVISDRRTRKITRWKKDRGSDDFEWFGGMVIAWKEALNPRHNDSMALYRVCCDLGEEKFFFLVLKPWFDAAHGRGPIPDLCLPDFIPHDGT